MDAQSERDMEMTRVDFGDEVEQFLKTRVGRYMLQMAQLNIDEAVEELKKCDAEDFKAVRKWQNKIQVAESIQQWLLEAVAAGLQALQRLDEAQYEN